MLYKQIIRETVNNVAYAIGVSNNGASAALIKGAVAKTWENRVADVINTKDVQAIAPELSTSQAREVLAILKDLRNPECGFNVALVKAAILIWKENQTNIALRNAAARIEADRALGRAVLLAAREAEAERVARAERIAKRERDEYARQVARNNKIDALNALIADAQRQLDRI